MDAQDTVRDKTAGVSASRPSYEDATPECDLAEEIRFAVVMYGGVSLAIYINGIAQELLNLVYASAPSEAMASQAQAPLKPNKELKGAQPVYRVIAQCLARWREGDRDVRTILSEAIKHNDIRHAAVALADKPIRTRFVVDILSGTSAGGINAIFLAKALANGQSIDGLKKLWVQEGDLALLINDDVSVKELAGWKVTVPQTSLLNSRRMYQKLLEAFDDLEISRPSQKDVDSSLVGELDLFVTTTDINGLPLPVKLADKIIYEKRHRNVLHFRYSGSAGTDSCSNDFLQRNDAFLAFAARCTSSFPFAFDPMRLADIDEVTRGYKDKALQHEYRRAHAERQDWERFYPEYWRRSMIDLQALSRRGREADRPLDDIEAWLNQEQKELKRDFRERAFGDGGYLDNKPFSYATSMLARRHADVPVYRKLIYVEPTPEHPENEATVGTKPAERPDFAENVRAALLDLPSKEMIREDIDRVLERNALLARVSSYMREVDADLARLVASDTTVAAEEGDPVKVAGLSLTHMIQRNGLAYGAYHRLRIDDVSSAIAELITRAAQHDPRSHACGAIRAVLDVWRQTRYAPDPVEGKQMESQFLAEFDSRYELRRLAFLNRRINELALLDGKAEQLLTAWLTGRVSAPELKSCIETWQKDEQWKRDFRARLRATKKEANEQLRAVRKYEEQLCQSNETGDTDLTPFVRRLGIDWDKLAEILEKTGRKRTEHAEQLLDGNPDRAKAIEDLVQCLRTRSAAMRKNLNDLAPADSGTKVDLANGDSVAQACVRYYAAHFWRYDMVLFPVQYGTGSSEASEVEIYRISPEDATALIDERTDPRKRHKLAGTFLMNFGAFLEKTWRENDMLWGRLDGAERLITAIMPVIDEENGDRALRRDLIRHAQSAILAEELSLEKLDEMRGLLVECLATEAPRLGKEPRRELLNALRERLNQKENDLPLALQTVLTACLSDRDQLWNYYSTSYDVNRQPNAENAVRLIARGTRVTTSMLDGLAAKYRRDFKSLGWIATLASVFWGMVEVAVPNSVAHIFWRHWLKIIYILDGILIAGGIALGRPEVTTFGWGALGVTVAATLAVAVLSDFIAGEGLSRWLNAAKAVAIVIALVLMGAGFMYLRSILPKVVEQVGGLEYLRGLVLAAIVALIALAVIASGARLAWRAIRARR